MTALLEVHGSMTLGHMMEELCHQMAERDYAAARNNLMSMSFIASSIALSTSGDEALVSPEHVIADTKEAFDRECVLLRSIEQQARKLNAELLGDDHDSH